MSTQPKENKEEQKEEELANVAASNQDPDERYRIPSYQRRYNDRAASYCCESLKRQVEGGLDGTWLGYIQYDGWLKEFVIVHPSGHPVACVKYCLWCGAHIGAGRELYPKKHREYVRGASSRRLVSLTNIGQSSLRALIRRRQCGSSRRRGWGRRGGAKPQGSY